MVVEEAVGPSERTLAEGMLNVSPDATSFARVSRSELYRAISDGSLRSYKLGRRRMLTKPDLIEWLKNRLVTGG